MKHKILLMVAAAAFLVPLTSASQNVSANEYIKAKSLWFNSSNTAGFAFDELTNFNDVKILYDYKSGDFKRQQQGDDETTINFNTNGAYNLKGFQMWGNFDYLNTTVKDSRFNTMLYDPLREMPYIVADSIYSKWKRQSYVLNFKGSTPVIWDFMSFGLEASYMANTAAKQKDPRSTDYYYTIYVNPNVLFRLGSSSRHFIGANFNYSNSFERTVPTNSDSQNDQQVFLLKGLGNSVNATVGGIGGINTFFYKGNRLGGGMQYAYTGDIINFLAEGGYTYGVENAYQNTSKPEKMGSVKQNAYYGRAQLLLKDSYTQKFAFDYSNRQSDGIEFVQVIDRSESVQDWVTLAKYIRSNYQYKTIGFTYDFFDPFSNKGYKWNAGTSIKYIEQDDTYYMPESKLEAENVLIDVYLKKNFAVCKKSFLLAGVDFGCNANIKGNWTYGGADPNSVIIREMYNKDFAYLTSDYYIFGALLNYSASVNEKFQLYVDAKAKYYKPVNSQYSNRYALTFALGLAF